MEFEKFSQNDERNKNFFKKLFVLNLKFKLIKKLISKKFV